MVLPVAVATLGVGGVHRLEMRSDQLLVPDQNASLHVGEDSTDPVDLRRRQRDRVFQLEQDEPREAEIVLGHAEGGVERRDARAERDDAARQRRLGPLLGDVAEQPDRDPEDRRLVDRRREEIGEPVLEFLAALRGDPVDGALRPPALAAGLERLDVAGRLELLDCPVEAAGLADRVGLVAFLQQALELVRMAGLLAEQAERGQGHHVLGLSADFHIAFRTIAQCHPRLRASVLGSAGPPRGAPGGTRGSRSARRCRRRPPIRAAWSSRGGRRRRRTPRASRW